MQAAARLAGLEEPEEYYDEEDEPSEGMSLQDLVNRNRVLAQNDIL